MRSNDYYLNSPLREDIVIQSKEEAIEYDTFGRGLFSIRGSRTHTYIYGVNTFFSDNQGNSPTHHWIAWFQTQELGLQTDKSYFLF